MIKRRAHSVFEVNLSSLKYNFDKLKQISKSEPIFMVKANAYGHGIAEVVNYCETNKLCSHFGVASVDELADIKNITESTFWIFSELDLQNNLYQYKNSNIIPVISNINDLQFFLENFDHSKLSLKFDTGMNRIGFKVEQLELVLEMLLKYKINRVKHLMTHFSSSYFEINNESKTKRQFSTFEDILNRFKEANIIVEESSCSNSGAIEQSFGTELTHIRPGLMMYGAESFGVLSGPTKNDFKVLSSLKTKMISLNFYKAGSEIGYGDQVLKSDGWIGVIPLGYADGILTSYSKAQIMCGEVKGHIWGRTNMDMAFVYFSKRPKTDKVIIWSDNLSEFSRQVKSIPYQVLTCISQRVPKVYIF